MLIKQTLGALVFAVTVALFADHIRVEVLPEVQTWLRVFYADGSSPGRLLHDGSQTDLAGVSC